MQDSTGGSRKPKARGRSRKAGLAPGTLVHIGEAKVEKVHITVIDYDKDNFDEREVPNASACLPFREKPTVTWINVSGVHELEIIEQLGRCYDLHPLLLEDIVNTTQRPKAEDFDKYVYIVLKMLYAPAPDNEITSEQVSIILGSNYVITFQEREGDVFDAVRNRLRTDKGRIRKMGADYLAYSLMDAIVDNYFAIMEGLGETIEVLEEEVVETPERGTLGRVYDLKRELISLRRSVWPLREVVAGLERGESPLFAKTTLVYMRDIYDHTIQVIDTIEAYRDMVAGLVDVYLSSISNRMNEVMKVLTMIATIFIPLSFFVGLYGMNFNPSASPYNMPELNWRYGYPAVLGFMLVMVVGMLFYFRRKHWF